jgi:hypothetical protein
VSPARWFPLPKPRFSKQSLIDYIERRQTELEAEFGFTARDGWSQVEGKGEEINRAYGEYTHLSTLVDVFEL